MAADSITISGAAINDVYGNQAVAHLNYTVPAIEPTPAVPTFQSATLFADNSISATESNSGVDLAFNIASPSALANGKLDLFMNNVLLKTVSFSGTPTSPVTIALTAADLGEDGPKEFYGRVETASGKASGNSITKTAELDTSVSDITQLTLSTDTNIVGTIDDGDVIIVTFAETVKLEGGGTALGAFSAATQSAFGTNPTVTAIASDTNGFATSWTVTLGTGSTITTATDIMLGVGAVQDVSGNTNTGTLSMNVPDNIVSARQAPTVLNVADNNVITNSEPVDGETFTIPLDGSKAQIGDVVRLYTDGIEIGSVTSSNLPNSVSVDVAKADWGADGVKEVTARIDGTPNGGNLSDASIVREVQVSSTTHWTKNNAIWFDADSISQAAGTTLNEWTASAGASTDKAILRVGKPTVGQNSDGAKHVLLNSSSSLNFSDDNNILAAGRQNINVFVVSKSTTTLNDWAWSTAVGDGAARTVSVGQNGTDVALIGVDLLITNAVNVNDTYLSSNTVYNSAGSVYHEGTVIGTSGFNLNLTPTYRYIGGQAHNGVYARKLVMA